MSASNTISSQAGDFGALPLCTSRNIAGDAGSRRLRGYVRQHAFETNVAADHVDAMIRRRALDEQSEVVVACALKGLSIPRGTLPPTAPSVAGNDVMRPWLRSMDAKSVRTLGALEWEFNIRREHCLGFASPLDRLRAVDAVRRSLIVAVSRKDAEVVPRAMDLLNSLGAGDSNSIGITSDDCASLEVLEEALDSKVRPLEYWLAIHHFESRWLCEQRRAMLARGRTFRVA